MRGPSSREGTLRGCAGGEDRKWVGAEDPWVFAGRLCPVRDRKLPSIFPLIITEHLPLQTGLTLLPAAICLGHSPDSPPRSSRASAAAGVGHGRSQLTLRPRTIMAMNPTPQVSPRSVPRKGPGSPRQGLARPPGPQHLPSSDERGGQDGQHDAPTPVRLPAVPVPGLLGDRVSTDHLAFR